MWLYLVTWNGQFLVDDAFEILVKGRFPEATPSRPDVKGTRSITEIQNI